MKVEVLQWLFCVLRVSAALEPCNVARYAAASVALVLFINNVCISMRP